MSISRFAPSPAANINVTISSDRPVNEIQLDYIALDDRISDPEDDQNRRIRSHARRRARALSIARTRRAHAGRRRPRRELWAIAEVDADPLLAANVAMTLAPGARLSGRLVFEGSAAQRGRAPARVSCRSRSRPGRCSASPPATRFYDVDTSTFSIEGIMPGRYLIQAGRAERNRSPWMLKAATVRGRDVLDEPIELASRRGDHGHPADGDRSRQRAVGYGHRRVRQTKPRQLGGRPFR